MPNTNSFASEKMWISGSRIGWVYAINTNSAGNTTITLLWQFDSLASQSEIKLPRGPGAGSKNIDVKLADGFIVRFHDYSGIIDGISENEIIDAAGGADASNWGDITLVTTAAPINTGFTSLTSFLMDAKAKNIAANKLLVIASLPYTALRMGQGNARGVDGFVYMIGKITNDLSVPSSVPSNITLTFASQFCNDFNPDPITFTDGITVKRGGSGKDVPASINIPLALDSLDIGLLAAGQTVIKANTTA